MRREFDNAIWKHYWEDGSHLALYSTPDDYVLIEYDADGNPVSYPIVDGYSFNSSAEVNYPKNQWTYEGVLEDIEDLYEL